MENKIKYFKIRKMLEKNNRQVDPEILLDGRHVIHLKMYSLQILCMWFGY